MKHRVNINSIRILIGIWLSTFAAPVSGQIYINEFLASNSTVNADPDNQVYADWIELYNPGNSAINLKGYFLTDNPGNPGKWEFPANFFIQPKGYALVWTDGLNNGVHTSFKLSSSGEAIGLFSPGLELIDSITFSLQKRDISFGRKTDGSAEWGYFTTPTPAGPNNTPCFTDFVKNFVEFTIKGGIYNSPVSLELYSDLGGSIRYTTDGSEPDAGSPLYTGAIAINTTRIIRARIFKPDMIPGPVVTNSYFINEGFETRNLPVVSIATAPVNFWDPVKGIYVQDFKPLWEVPVNIELFENNGSDRAAFNEQAGIKINGLYSWQLPQKMLGVYFRKEYGSNTLAYPLLFNRSRANYQTFALRASGSDWSYTMFRDILGQDASRYNMHLDFIGFRHSIVYVNGAYMGIHNIREKVDEGYIEENYHLEPGTFDLVSNQDLAEAGDLTAYNQLLSLLVKDLSVQSNYDAVAASMDIENFTELIIAEMALANISIDHNVMAWKQKDSGKWKWILLDLDRGFFNPSDNLIDFYLNQSVWPFKNLMSNTAYKAYFGRKLADHLYTSFNPLQIDKLVDEHKQAIEAEIPFHVARWLGTTSSYGDAMPSVAYWYQEVCKLKSFAAERPQALLADLANYGFSTPATLNISIAPAGGGNLFLNGLLIPGSKWNGLYPINETIHFSAVSRPGYVFKGWSTAVQKVLVAKGSTWKYLDNGSDQGTAWIDSSFNDATWKPGQAELGYGDGNEATTVGYGGDAQNKYITSYFRQSFVASKADKEASMLIINLKKDDGAIIYLNGNEILRSNITCSPVTYRTLAIDAVGGASESEFNSYLVDGSALVAGKNLLAVEIHQNAVTSSDISFDLELTSYSNTAPGYVSTSPAYDLAFAGDRGLMAIFEPTGQCIVPEIISKDTTLKKDCSPYLVQGDVTILPGVTLTLEPGVEILMPSKGNIIVNGTLNAVGTADERISFRSNPADANQAWGAITFLNTIQPSSLAWVTIENASRGSVPIRDYAAISAYKGDLIMDHLLMENNHENPIVARYSNVVLTNSIIHSSVEGDGINVKYGKARVENCQFEGDDMPNMDAVDYDDVQDGVIKKSIIRNFVGFNSDGIDIGEETSNLLVDSVLVFNIFDKGISVGQKSSAAIRNSIFVNCNLGAGLKDLSPVTIDHCNFYADAIPVDCFEKIPGRAGGIATVTNSILSNSSVSSFAADAESSLDITYSLSDNDSLPAGNGNLFANPLFEDPAHYIFNLLPGSPGINAGSTSDMGAGSQNIQADPLVLFCRVFTNSLNLDLPEFIALYNPSTHTIDLSDYSIDQGFTFTFPAETYLLPGDTLYLTDDEYAGLWFDCPRQVLQWTSGKLSNQGESLQIRDKHSIIVDHIRYEDNGKWPLGAFRNGEVMILQNTSADNHFPENWQSIALGNLFTYNDSIPESDFLVFPNPARNRVNIITSGSGSKVIEIYSILGELLGREQVDVSGYTTVDLERFSRSMLIIRIGPKSKKIMLLK